MIFRSLLAAALVLTAAVTAKVQRPECPPYAHGLAFHMLHSNIARGQGLEASNASTGQIELGIFQQALRESIAFTNDTSQKANWTTILKTSTASAIENLSNATKNTGLPLDRLSIGTAMIYQYQETSDSSYIPAITALQQSVAEQQQNANGGLWYYANPNNLSAYHNLSYLDGMFSYAPFAVLSSETRLVANASLLNAEAAWDQLRILRNITAREDGLSVHGYDASKAHRWADPVTGASPVVWGRALAWYTLGIVNSLELLAPIGGTSFQQIKTLFKDLVLAQLRASNRSLEIEGSYGVWQVVDRPGALFAGVLNFVEASSSLMTAYSLLKAARLGLLDDEDLKSRAQITGVGMFQGVKQQYLIQNANGTLSLNGTSSVATLSGDLDYLYYVSRPTVLNSLIGTSAFILAGLEVEKLC